MRLPQLLPYALLINESASGTVLAHQRTWTYKTRRTSLLYEDCLSALSSSKTVLLSKQVFVRHWQSRLNSTSYAKHKIHAAVVQHAKSAQWNRMHQGVVNQHVCLFFQRRGAISFERTDRNAIYIRMLGEYWYMFVSSSSACHSSL